MFKTYYKIPYETIRPDLSYLFEVQNELGQSILIFDK